MYQAAIQSDMQQLLPAYYNLNNPNNTSEASSSSNSYNNPKSTTTSSSRLSSPYRASTSTAVTKDKSKPNTPVRMYHFHSLAIPPPHLSHNPSTASTNSTKDDVTSAKPKQQQNISTTTSTSPTAVVHSSKLSPLQLPRQVSLTDSSSSSLSSSESTITTSTTPPSEATDSGRARSTSLSVSFRDERDQEGGKKSEETEVGDASQPAVDKKIVTPAVTFTPILDNNPNPSPANCDVNLVINPSGDNANNTDHTDNPNKPKPKVVRERSESKGQDDYDYDPYNLALAIKENKDNPRTNLRYSPSFMGQNNSKSSQKLKQEEESKQDQQSLPPLKRVVYTVAVGTKKSSKAQKYIKDASGVLTLFHTYTLFLSLSLSLCLSVCLNYFLYCFVCFTSMYEYIYIYVYCCGDSGGISVPTAL